MMDRGEEAGPATATGIGTILDAARRGDAEALGKALEPFRDYLLLVANREIEPDLRPKLGASDLVQEAFLGAHRDLNTYRGNGEVEWRLWLRGILVHAIANHRRRFRAIAKRKVDREVSIARFDWPSGSPSPSAQVAGSEIEAAVLGAMDRLTENHRNVVLWHHRDQVPFAEVGERLGISADAARKLWERALKALRKELGTTHGCP